MVQTFTWFHLPFVDGGIPARDFEDSWRAIAPDDWREYEEDPSLWFPIRPGEEEESMGTLDKFPGTDDDMNRIIEELFG